MMRTAVWLVAAAVASATAGLSQTPSVDTTKRGVSNDPNEVICVRERETGSRVAQRRVCRTRAQWEEFHQQTRMAIEKAQLDKPTNNQ